MSVRSVRPTPQAAATAGLLIAAALAMASPAAVAGERRAVAANSAALRSVKPTGVVRKMRTRPRKTAIAGRRADAPLPVIYSFPVGAALGTVTPDRSPAGANDWSCRPSAAHPYPVVLVHGTFENMIINWNALSPLLFNRGYCVFALNFGSKGALPIKALDPVASSAVELRIFVDRVLAATGAEKVDVVGHSQGGMMPRQYLKFEGGSTKVRTLVGLTPSNHGTSAAGFLTLLGLIPGATSLLNLPLDVICEACNDQMAGSPFMKALNAGGDTVPGVSYTVIVTRRDQVVTPYSSGFLSGPGVTNITVQDGCRLDQAEHVAISYDSRALTYVLNALDPDNPIPVPCRLVLPGMGG